MHPKHDIRVRRNVVLVHLVALSKAVPDDLMARRKICMMVCLEGCDPSGSGSGMNGTASFLGKRDLTLFSCLIIAQWGHIGLLFWCSQMQLCPLLTHIPVVWFFCIGSVKKVVLAMAVDCLHTWCILAAAASIPRSTLSPPLYN